MTFCSREKRTLLLLFLLSPFSHTSLKQTLHNSTLVGLLLPLSSVWSCKARFRFVTMPAAQKSAKKAAPKDAKATKVVRVSTRKAYTRPQFRRPHTYRKPATVKPSNRVTVESKDITAFGVIRYPLTTDKAMKKIEENNTLTFIVDARANKTEIKKAIRKLYQVKAVKVNTLIRPDGLKKAYIRLSAAHDALDTANKIGLV